MKLAKDALILFMQSLPAGCTFSVISYGSNFSALHGEFPYEEYTDENRDRAITKIDTFKSDYGGTDMYSPFKAALTQILYDSGKNKRIFCLTDGDIGSKARIIKRIKKLNFTTQVFTFGLGAGVKDKDLQEVATAGQGTHTHVKDNSEDLRSQVIRALNDAMQPCLKDASFGFNIG